MNLSVFTKTCTSCNKRIFDKSTLFCIECHADLPKTDYKFSKNNLVADKLAGILNIDNAISYLYYQQNEMVKKLLWEIKYNQNKPLAIELGRMSVSSQRQEIRDGVDCIVPIPLHKSKLRMRGYNQSELIGNGMAEVLNIPIYTDVLKRRRPTESQTNLDRIGRFKNLEDVFTIENASKIKAKRVLLVDDVITTGATIESAGRVILKHSPISLSIFTLATAIEI